MDSIRFETTVGDDGLIRLPASMNAPSGAVEVTVRPIVQNEDSNVVSETRNWLLEAASEAEAAGIELPADMAARHDYYAHGKSSE